MHSKIFELCSLHLVLRKNNLVTTIITSTHHSLQLRTSKLLTSSTSSWPMKPEHPQPVEQLDGTQGWHCYCSRLHQENCWFNWHQQLDWQSCLQKLCQCTQRHNQRLAIFCHRQWLCNPMKNSSLIDWPIWPWNLEKLQETSKPVYENYINYQGQLLKEKGWVCQWPHSRFYRLHGHCILEQHWTICLYFFSEPFPGSTQTRTTWCHRPTRPKIADLKQGGWYHDPLTKGMHVK